jgi:hypothetical protein
MLLFYSQAELKPGKLCQIFALFAVNINGLLSYMDLGLNTVICISVHKMCVESRVVNLVT